MPEIMPGKIFGFSPSPVRCTCEQAQAFWAEKDREEQQRAAEEAQRKEREAMRARIAKLTRESGIKARFQYRTFDTFQIDKDNKKAAGQCKRYADAFNQIMLPTKGHDGTMQPPQKERNGLFMTGGFGTGKTHLAAAIANELIRGGTPVICMTMIDLLAQIKRTFDRGGSATEAEIMRLYQDVPLLIIDDLGSEQPTEWGSTAIFSIINARYESYMPVIITSNYGSGELAERMTPAGSDGKNAKKTIDRLCEVCVGIEMNWPSWRTK